jgi:pimeloyl-ACP methyl ester carboxylesterase
MWAKLRGGSAPIPRYITQLYSADWDGICADPTALIVCQGTTDGKLQPTARSRPFNWRNLVDPNDARMVTLLMRELKLATPQQVFAHLAQLREQALHDLLAKLPAPNDPDRFSEGLYLSVMCSEEAPFYNVDDVHAIGGTIPPQLRPLIAGRTADVLNACAFWGARAITAAQRVAKPSRVLTLILNGTHDPITPPAWAKAAAAYLEQSHLKLFPGFGHAVLASGNECAKEISQAFFETPSREPDLPCYRQLRLKFE